jgi:hypothetical protein
MSAPTMPLVRAPHTLCRHCQTEVLVTSGGSDGRAKILDPTPVTGGLYRLDSRGRAVRRPISDMSFEIRCRTAVRGGGYTPHECPHP